ncbi:MAG: nitrogen fixation negative regulator NifL [Gammaproteobacteria bacterium]|nr:nitrogen fixation negative regulator NifL [Gammaproteobacteria bacterium]
MEKTSLKYLEIQSDIDKIINELEPGLLSASQGNIISKISNTQKKLLPAWLFVEAVEQAPVAISITDKKANIKYVNQAFSEATGYLANELIGKNQSALSYKKTPKHIYYDLWHTVSRKKIWHGQLLNKQKNGEPYIADLTVAPMLDSKKNISHYLGIHHNITEHYQAKKKLENQKHLIESVINASSVAMVVVDENNRVVMDNLQYKSLVSDLDNQEPANLFIDLLAQDFGDIHSYLAKHPKGINHYEVRIDGRLNHAPQWFSCSGKIFQEQAITASNFFEDTRQHYLLLSISNITTQKQQQEKIHLNSLKIMLAEEEQIRSIRETLLGTIHQVSQPLNQIQAAINLMQQKNEHGHLLDLLKQLETSCLNTVTTLNNCVPEIVTAAITPVNLNQILHETLSLNNSKFLANSIVIEWAPSAVLPKILGAENKLRMLFKQLIDNAINALNHSDSNERCIRIDTHMSNDMVIVHVDDTGPGIPENQHSKVFEPFYSTLKMGGTQAGMGLVMAKEIVYQMNGTIEIDQDYTSGCRFIITFPLISHDDYSEYDA